MEILILSVSAFHFFCFSWSCISIEPCIAILFPPSISVFQIHLSMVCLFNPCDSTWLISVCLQGHELTLRVLYRLFGEAEEDRDFFISTTATSVYGTFLLQVVCIMIHLSNISFLSVMWNFIFHIYCYSLIQAETLRDSFPATDKSLSRLLGEAPYLPNPILEMLECLCSPGGNDNDEKELHGGDRVTQGLSIVWSLILLRPPIRDACLKIALKVNL